MTFSEWMSMYFQLYKRDLAPKTRESYARLQCLLSPILGDIALASLSPDDLQAALVRIAEENGSRQAQLAYALIHAALSRAVKSRHLQYNPCDAIDKPKHVGEKGRALSDTDWKILQPTIDDDVAFALMARAGLRRGEVLALRWGDVNLATRLITVDKQLIRIGGY